MDGEDVNDPARAYDRPGGVDRRKLLAAGGLGAAAMWAAPAILSLDAASAGTKLPTLPDFVGAATGQTTTSGGTSVAVGSWAGPLLPLQTNDALLLIISMTLGTTLTVPAGWTILVGPNDNNPGGLIPRNQRSYLLYRNGGLTGTPTITLTYTSDSNTVRAAAVAYRNTTGGTIAVETPGTVNVKASNANATQTFPAATLTQPFSRVVRLGALGDWATLAFQPTHAWNSTPAGHTDRVANYNTPGATNGARAIKICDIASNVSLGTITATSNNNINSNCYSAVIKANTP